MSNVTGLMDIGRTSLLTQQTAMSVTGHNIANVNTDGYSRQLVKQATGDPLTAFPGSIGTGVRISEVKRSLDRFVTDQIETETGLLGKWKVKEQALRRIEISFNDSSGGGLNESITNFFNSWQTLSLNPDSETSRQAVIGKARIMSESFKKVSADISSVIRDVDADLEASVSDANRLISDISGLNKRIHDAESTKQNANDLNDSRDARIRELSGLIETSRVVQSGGQVAISTKGGGKPLVIGEASFSLKAVISRFDASIHDLNWANTNGSVTDISSQVSSGKLAGLLDVRSTLSGYRDKLDRLASEIIRTVNAAHAGGFGLDGSTGVDFFNPVTVTAKSSSANTGTGQVTTASVADPQNVSNNDFELAFTSASTFTLSNLTTGAASGTFSFSSGSVITSLQSRGISVTISGSVAAGDVFRISASDRASEIMSVNSEIILDTKKIAASLDNFAGDGSNAREISALIKSDVMGRVTGASSGTFTFTDFYSGLVSSVGSDSREAIDSVVLRSSVKINLEARREQTSGVSLDEEMINLIKFQQAYSAAARIITAAQDMLDTLLSMTR